MDSSSEKNDYEIVTLRDVSTQEISKRPIPVSEIAEEDRSPVPQCVEPEPEPEPVSQARHSMGLENIKEHINSSLRKKKGLISERKHPD